MIAGRCEVRASKKLVAKIGLLVSVFSISPISPATAAACAVSSSISGANTILLVTATGACEVTIPAGSAFLIKRNSGRGDLKGSSALKFAAATVAP